MKRPWQNTSMNKAFKIFLGLIIFVGVSLFGLSFVSWEKVAYNNGDWLIKRKVLEVFKLYKPQQDQLQVALDDYMSWHRSKMLPQYMNLLGDMSSRMREFEARKFAPEEIEPWVMRVRALYIQTFKGLAEKVIPILSTMNEEQVDRTRTLLDRRLDYWRDLKSVQKEYLLSDLKYSWRENFSHAFGELNEDQLKVIENQAAKILIPVDFQLSSEGTLNKGLMEALEVTPELEKESALHDYLDQWELDDHFIQWRVAFSKFCAKVLNYLTPEQIAFFQEKVAEYRELMANLINIKS